MRVTTEETQNVAARRTVSTCVSITIAPTMTLAVFLLVCGPGNAQPPGTLPPSEAVKGSAGEKGSGEGLSISGFMFLDVSGNPVMMPTMTYEQLMELESGSKTAQRPFVYKSLQINGTVDDGRAELSLLIRLSIDSTDGRLIPIPLNMGNFHLLRAPEFTSSPPSVPGRDIERMTIGADGGGYVVWVRADRPREIVVKMSVSARADQASRDSLYFRLPDVPAKINITIPEANAVGEINGTGDEVLVPVLTARGTEFRIESGGGSFQLHWGATRSLPTSTAQFEVKSSVTAMWNAPDAQPTVSVESRIRSLRDQVADFDVQLPPGAELISEPVLVESGRTVEITQRTQPGRFGISIPPDERQESMVINLKLTLAAAVDGWLGFEIPRIIGASTQVGDVIIKTSGDHRLRWRSSRGIQRTLNDSFDETPNVRSYAFQFDRGGFTMPIMLSAQQQKLRLACDSEIIIRDQSASMQMTIRTSGEASDSRQIELDFAGWNPQPIVDAESGEVLVIGTSGSKTQISLTQDDGGQASLIRINALRDITSDNGTIRFPLPRIDALDDALLIERNDVTIRSAGRLALVVDLEASRSIESGNAANGSGNAMVTPFRVLPPSAAATVVGNLVEQRPQITLESSANIMLDGNQLVTTVQWMVTSPSNLKGRLDVDIAPSAANTPRSEVAEPSNLENGLSQLSGLVSSGTDGWSVTVNGGPAQLIPSGQDRYILKSGLLGDGTFTIKWRNTAPIVPDATQFVGLPRLRNADVEVRDDIIVSLSGSRDTDLYAADSPGRTSLQFGEPPREPIRIRLVKRASREQELTVYRAVLRTAVGNNTRHEQVLALARGGDAFRVSVADDVNLIAEASVDRQRVSLQRNENDLSVQLPDDQQNHIVDIRVWVDEPSTGWLPNIKPTLKLPIGVGRVYWQIIVPEDSHVVWVTPTLGQAMTWQLDRWRLSRRPVLSDQTLCERIGTVDVAPMPPAGNRYLYVGTDFLSFQATVASRATIWLFVGGIMLACATALAYVPQLRTPLTAIVAAFFFAGLLALAPDAAVLLGQFAMVAVLLVIVMFAVRSLLLPGRSRLFPGVAAPAVTDGSTKTALDSRAGGGSSVRSTETVAAAEPSEVSS